MNLWKDCVRWLVDCQCVPIDHQLLWENAQVAGLANLLRDGVLLCQLANQLRPDCIDLKEVCLRPQLSQFLCLKNIRLFLQACVQKLELPPTELFEPDMLYDCSNFGRVLHTLSQLSHCSLVLKAGIKPFPEKLELVRCTDYYNEDLYKNLEELTLDSIKTEDTSMSLFDFSQQARLSITQASIKEQLSENGTVAVEAGKTSSIGTQIPIHHHQRRTHEEDIYEDLCYVTLRNQGKSTTASAEQSDDQKRANGVNRSNSSTSNGASEKRDYCVKELLETEKNYVDALNMLVSYFLRPLKCTLRPEDRSVIFFNITQLADLHDQFYEQLQAAAAQSPLDKVHCRLSECFLRFRHRFTIYGDYCANLPIAQNLLDTLCQKNEFLATKILQYQKQANGGKFKLRDLLSVPMQRILKYHLLLHELLRQSNGSNQETQNALKTAYEIMLDLGQFINEVKRDAETLQIIADIQRSITDLSMPEQTQLQDYGRLVRDGELKVRCHDEHKLKPRYVFVFDKVLLMCKAMRGEQYSYRQALVLLDYELHDSLPYGQLSPAASPYHHQTAGVNGNDVSMQINSGHEPAFMPLSPALIAAAKLDSRSSHHLYLVHQSQQHVFTFYAKTEEQKQLWMSAIRTAMDNASPQSPICHSDHQAIRHSFIMSSFENPFYCDHCDRLLKGKFFQGYRCVVCSLVVHKQCIPNSGQCGPPVLPPRRLVSSNSCQGEFHDKRYPLSATSSSLNGQHPFNAHVPVAANAITKNFDPAYVNLRLESYAWFAGQMDRERAQNVLRSMPHATFLVRVSCKQKGNFALSVNDSGEVKHMRILQTENGQFYLSQSKTFDSIVQLIRWYEQHSLAESFVGLNIALEKPYKILLSNADSNHMQAIPDLIPAPPLPPSVGSRRAENGSIDLGSSNNGLGASNNNNCVQILSSSNGSAGVLSLARALYRFTGESSSLLSFQKGDLIEVLSKAGEKKGWWKGRIKNSVSNQVGYFPYKYVHEL